MGEHGLRCRRAGIAGVPPGSIARDLAGPHTEFSIEVHRASVTHRLKLQQVTCWADGGGKSPREVIERNRIRELLGTKTQGAG